LPIPGASSDIMQWVEMVDSLAERKTRYLTSVYDLNDIIQHSSLASRLSAYREIFEQEKRTSLTFRTARAESARSPRCRE